MIHLVEYSFVCISTNKNDCGKIWKLSMYVFVLLVLAIVLTSRVSEISNI